jgi:myo-inositol 2-dehydrogenase/D-chiro-inositol 1-dehydrogenase
MKQRSATDNDGDMQTYDDLVDEGAVLTLKFANGCCGTFVCADNVTSPFLFEAGTGENPTIPFNDSISGFYRIFGSKGTLSLPDMKLYHQLTESESSWLKPMSTSDVPLGYHGVTHDLFGMISPSPSPATKYEYNEKPKPFDLQLDHFINIINGDESMINCTGEDALRALLCIDAVMKSIDTGLPQYVENIESIQPDLELLARFS